MDEGRGRIFLARGREESKQVRQHCRKEEEEWGEQGCNKEFKECRKGKRRMNAGKKCGKSIGQKETEIEAKGMKKRNGSILRIGEEKGYRSKGTVMETR